MKKLILTFVDGSKVTYTMQNSTDWKPYFNRHRGSKIATAKLQQYPKKEHVVIILV